MMKRNIKRLQRTNMIFLLLSCVSLSSGCNTMKGLKEDTKETWNNVSEGAEKFDQWWQKNVW